MAGLTHASAEARASADPDDAPSRRSKARPVGVLSNEEYKAELARQVEEQKRRKREEEERAKEREELDEKRLARQQRELLAQVQSDIAAASSKQQQQQAPAPRRGALPRTPPAAYVASIVAPHHADSHEAGAATPAKSKPHERAPADTHDEAPALMQRLRNQPVPHVSVLSADDEGGDAPCPAQRRSYSAAVDGAHAVDQQLQRDLALYSAPTPVAGSSKENNPPQQDWDKVRPEASFKFSPDMIAYITGKVPRH